MIPRFGRPIRLLGISLFLTVIMVILLTSCNDAIAEASRNNSANATTGITITELDRLPVKALSTEYGWPHLYRIVDDATGDTCYSVVSTYGVSISCLRTPSE